MELPPRGSAGDVYLQFLMKGELDREAALAKTMIYKNWAMAPGEGGQTMADNTGKAFEEFLGKLFPWQQGHRESRDKKQLKVLEKFMRAFGAGDVVDKASEAPPQKPENAGKKVAQKLKDMFLPKKKET